MLATDGSPSAEGATNVAIELAGRLGLPLDVVCVSQAPTPLFAYDGYAEVIAELDTIQEEAIGEVLARVEREAGAAGVPCTTFSRHGPPGEQICTLARLRHTRLLVIGAHGWGNVGRLLHGSVSSDVLRHATTPVLVVRGHEHQSGSPLT